MSFVVIGILAAAGLAYVLLPLLRPAAPVVIRPEVTDAESRKAFALQAILDLETDHAAGKLSDDELATLRIEHEVEAVAAMRELDVLRADDE